MVMVMVMVMLVVVVMGVLEAMDIEFNYLLDNLMVTIGLSI
jgi:uncharacterized membrane protein YciS (DUF1049 family)